MSAHKVPPESGRFNFQKVADDFEVIYDVVDWPEPGDWPGRVVKRTHRGHTNRLGKRWFPQVRTPCETPLGPGHRWEPVGYDHGYETRQRAGEVLIEALQSDEKRGS